MRAAGLLAAQDRVLVAVSAGADSTALALLLDRLRDHAVPLDLELAHLEHGWRSAREAARDRAAVQALADRLQKPLHLVERPSDPPSTEDAARRWRYDHLARLARLTGRQKVATGHHADDQAETVLLRLWRRSGRVGLAGMPAHRALGSDGVHLVRPLLPFPRERLRAWLVRDGQAWVEDRTNDDARYDRARARHVLRAASGAELTTRLLRVGTRTRRRIEARRAQLRTALERALVLYPRAAAASLPHALLQGLTRLDLHLALLEIGAPLAADRAGPWLTRRLVERAAHVVASGGALDLPRGLRLRVAGGRAWLHRRDAARPVVPSLCHEELPRASVDLDKHRQRADRSIALLDADRLGPAPRLRPPHPEDRFVPHGHRGVVRVTRWLARQSCPREVQRGELVLEGKGGVAWVVGRRIDARHAVSATTRRVARVALGPEPSPSRA